MGNAVSSWAHEGPKRYFYFLASLFGRPYTLPSLNIAIWSNSKLKQHTMFGQPVVFCGVVLVDELLAVPDPADGEVPRQYFMTLYVKMTLTANQLSDLMSITNNFGYDAGYKTLMVSCDCIDTGVASLRVLTDYITGKITAADAPAAYKSALAAVYSSNGNVSNLTRENYKVLTANLGVVTENFLDDPWYAKPEPWYMGGPDDTALGDSEEEAYYRDVVGSLPYYELENERILAGAKTQGKQKPVPPPARLVGTSSNDQAVVGKAITALNSHSGQVRGLSK